jgi:hypothetical protein
MKKNIRHYFYCGKQSKGIIYLKQKVRRVCFEICEARCKRGLNPEKCQIYMKELDAVTTPAS